MSTLIAVLLILFALYTVAIFGAYVTEKNQCKRKHQHDKHEIEKRVRSPTDPAKTSDQIKNDVR